MNTCNILLENAFVKVRNSSVAYFWPPCHCKRLNAKSFYKTGSFSANFSVNNLPVFFPDTVKKYILFPSTKYNLVT